MTLTLACAAEATSVPKTIFVDINAPGPTYDGSSWDRAYTDLQDALDDAAGGGFEIWVAEGTYKPHSDFGDQYGTFSLINGVALYGGFSGGETSITQRNWESNETILSGDVGVIDNNADNCYHVVTGSGTANSAVLDGFTIRNGHARDGFGSGGGMYNGSGSPTVRNCTFSGNSAVSGGGMYNVNSNPTVTNCTFFDNTAGYAAGGMFNSDSSPTVTECTFVDNEANRGGGMSNFRSSPTVTQCTFTSNSAYSGGGIWNQDGSSPTVTDCTFSGNTAGYGGGGMYNQDSSPTVANCTFSDNTADSNGGGMCNEASGPSVTNCTFFGNTAYSSGGGMYNEESSPSVANCTFSGNNASYRGAGMANTLVSNPTVKNTIIADNPSGEDCHCSDDSSITSEGYNLDSDGSCITDGVNHDMTRSDPLLSPLADNGGLTETCALLFGSPALDAGSCDAATDQRGVDRPQPAGGACDIGAVEMRWFTLTVTKAGAGTGKVTSGPAGINCDGSCTTSYTKGTQVTLTATPVADSLFVSWSGGATGSNSSVLITMNGDEDVTATFIQASTLTVQVDGTGGGSVTGTGIDCTIAAGSTSGDCSEKIARDATVTLTATPAADSLFAGWGGDATGSDPSVSVTMDDDKDVTATFTIQPFTVGDVNGDSAIDLLDVVLCAQIAQGIIEGSPRQRAAADFDGDGDVDMDDVSILSDYILSIGGGAL